MDVPMKRAALLVIVFLIALFTPRPTSAACRMLPPGQTCDTGQFPQKYSLNDGGSPQCTKGSNGQYNVCCDFESEANAADSVRAPICGSSQELGKANSSCWTCGGDLRCAGLDFGLKKDDTSPELFNKQAISPTDTIEDMDKVWRVDTGENFPETFRFNGIEYNRNGRGIVMCRSNVLGCGASDVSCTSTLFPNEDITDEVTDDPNAGRSIPVPVDNFIPPARPASTEKLINPIPWNTAHTKSYSDRHGFARWLTAAIYTLRSFGQDAGDGKPKTTVTNFGKEAELMMNLFEPSWRSGNKSVGGGALSPRMLQQRLRYSSDKENNDINQSLISRDCGWFDQQPDLYAGYNSNRDQGKVNETVAESEPYKRNFHYFLDLSYFLGAIVGTERTKGDPGIPGVDFAVGPRVDVSKQNGETGQFDILPQWAALAYKCGAESGSRPVDPQLLNIFGNIESSTRLSISTPGERITEFIKVLKGIQGCAADLEECYDRFVMLNARQTMTIVNRAHPALYASNVGFSPDEPLPGGVPANAKEELSQSKGWTTPFFAQSIIESSFKVPTDRTHGKTPLDIIDDFQASPLQVSSERIELAQGGTAEVKRRFHYVVDCTTIPLSIQQQEGSDCNPTDDAVSRQHGSLDVPTELSRAVEATWDEKFGEGILGKDFLEQQYTGRLNLITTSLTDEQRVLLMTKIQGLINTYVTNGAWPNSQLGNTRYQGKIRDAAQQYGLNEAFLYALWIEETHASSVGDYPFGCGASDTFEKSLECVTTNPTVQTYIRDPLPDALCMYADGHRGCTFEAHPNFVRNLMYYYDTLTTP